VTALTTPPPAAAAHNDLRQRVETIAAGQRNIIIDAVGIARTAVDCAGEDGSSENCGDPLARNKEP